MKIFINFTSDKTAWMSASIFYIHTNNPNLEITEDKDDDYDLSVENFENLEDLLAAIKLKYLPYVDYVAINKWLDDQYGGSL